MSSQSYFFNPQDDRMSCAGSGLQLPRLSSTQRLALTVGANDAGLQVFDITLQAMFVWTGSEWTKVVIGAFDYFFFEPPINQSGVTYTSSWINPSPTIPRKVQITVQGGAGGGGSGRRGAPGSVRCGGGGGSAGQLRIYTALTTNLPAQMSVGVGCGGAGGAGVQTNNTNGNAGLTGQGSYVVLDPDIGTQITAGGGPFGSGGTSATGNGGGSSPTGNTVFLTGGATQGGQSASTTGAAPAGAATANSQVAFGGGAGGGITVANAVSPGGSGGYPSVGLDGGASLTTPGDPFGDVNAIDAQTFILFGVGGSGGASAIGAVSGNGSKGVRGSGGGGGGASENGFASGSGGQGGAGFVEIIVF